MNKILENKLYKKYPKLFEDRKLGISKSAMSWGCQIGDGWFLILDVLCSVIEGVNRFYLKNTGIEASFKFSTVKEKFGTLRVYYHLEANDKKKGAKYDRTYIDKMFEYIGGAVVFANILSSITCEKCGTNENVSQNKKGYISTLCKKCRKEKK